MSLPAVLIPAYCPDERLTDLVADLLPLGFRCIIVVDDGSGPAHADVFARCEALGVRLLRHDTNHGKGRALKTGIAALIACGDAESGVVTADADGQHAPADILKVAKALRASPSSLVLGVRAFSGNVPLRSRVGNGLTRFFFALVNGSAVRDTQTGLRGIPGRFCADLLVLSGDRYEFEMNMLLSARPAGYSILQVPIDTIYIEGNRSSHFDVLRDPIRIYGLLFAFLGSSLVAAGVDYAVFALVTTLLPGVLVAAVVIARVASSLVNFGVNHHLVFRQKGSPKDTMLKYYALVLAVMVAGYLIISALQAYTPLGLYVSKLFTDIGLYFVSFVVQREFVYRKKILEQNP